MTSKPKDKTPPPTSAKQAALPKENKSTITYRDSKGHFRTVHGSDPVVRTGA